MIQFDTKSLKAEAQRRVAAAPGSQTLVLLYCGVLALLTLATNGLQLYLDSQISSTGGLSGLGLRSVLQTVESVLSYINTFFGPFWQAGFLFGMISLVRGTPVGPKHLGEGFRRFGRVLAYTLNNALLTMVLAFVSMLAGSMIYSVSPWAMDFAEAMGPALSDPNLILADGTVNMELIPMDAIMVMLPPLMIIFALIFLPLQIYVNYALRMGQYLMMEGGLMTGMGAMLLSWRLTKGHRMQLLKLDLSYWYYYALLFGAALVGYLDVWLSLAGISLPIDATVLYFVTLVLYLVAELAISLWKKREVDTASILIYESILHPEPAQQDTQIIPADSI